MTEIILAVALLVVLAFFLYRERERDRREDKLLDRIQAPHAFQAAALEQVPWPEFPPEPDPYTDVLPTERHDDLALQALLGEDT